MYHSSLVGLLGSHQDSEVSIVTIFYGFNLFLNRKKLECFSLCVTYTLVKHVQAWLDPTPPSIASNIRLGWKLLKVTNTPAYYGTEIITAVKKL